MTQDNEKVVGVGAEYAENTVEGASPHHDIEKHSSHRG